MAIQSTETLDYSAHIEEGIATLTHGKCFSMHLIDHSKPANHGFIEVVITKEDKYVRLWKDGLASTHPVDYVQIDIEKVVRRLDELGLRGDRLFFNDKFGDLVGKNFRVYECKSVEDRYAILSDDRLMLIHRSTVWEDVENLYGVYSKPTMH